MRKWVAILSLLAVISVSQSVEIVLWDFETDLGGWGPGAGTVSLGMNPLTGSQCMVLGATPEGWQTGAYNTSAGDAFIDLSATPIIQLELTYVASEWDDIGWITQDTFIINSDGGWGQVNTADDGSWGAWAGDVTKVVNYDYSAYNLSGGWSQLSIMINGGTPTSGVRGNYYIDNIKAIGPDPVTPWHRYECEDGILNDEAFLREDADCSGGEYVHITSDEIEGSIKISVNVRDAGTYNMRYGQNSYDAQRYDSFYINDVETVVQQFSGLVSLGVDAAVEGNNDWDDEAAAIQDLFDSVEFYGSEDGNWQIWSRFAEAYNTERLNTTLAVDLETGINTIEIRTVWGWTDWDYIELELGVQPRNPSPADGAIAVIADTPSLSWDNAVHNLDSIEVWFGETPVVDPNDPNTILSGDTYQNLLTLIHSETSPGESTSIEMPEIFDGTNYTWVVDGVILGDSEPNNINYDGPFWSFYATDNAPPTANAGEDQYKWLVPPDPNVVITLDGSGSTDDGADAPLTYSWTQTAGPAASIDTPDADITSVTLTGGLGNDTEDGAGDPYEFQLEIYDGLWTRTDTVTIYVNSDSCAASIEAGSFYYYGDIASEAGAGIPDCTVDLLDFAEMALNWLGCTNTFEACN